MEIEADQDVVQWLETPICTRGKFELYFMEAHDGGIFGGYGLKEFIDNDILKPAAADAQSLDAWQKKVAKTRRILLQGFQDHIVSSIRGKETPYAMWKDIDLFQSSNDHRKFSLKDKLRKIKMEKGDKIQKYLTKFTQCRHELGSIGITLADDDLVSLALLGLPKIWHSYQDYVNGREKLQN